MGEQLHALHERYRRWSVELACAAARHPAGLLGLHPRPALGRPDQARRARRRPAARAPRPGRLRTGGLSLDTATAYGVWTTLRRYADAGAAVLAITHDVPVLAAARITGHLALMRGGRVVAAGGLADPAALDGPYPRGFFRPAGH